MSDREPIILIPTDCAPPDITEHVGGAPPADWTRMALPRGLPMGPLERGSYDLQAWRDRREYIPISDADKR